MISNYQFNRYTKNGIIRGIQHLYNTFTYLKKPVKSFSSLIDNLDISIENSKPVCYSINVAINFNSVKHRVLVGSTLYTLLYYLFMISFTCRKSNDYNSLLHVLYEQMQFSNPTALSAS